MAIRAFSILYAGLIPVVADPASWADRPLWGAFVVIHAVLGLALVLKTDRAAAAQWLGLWLVLIAFAVAIVKMGGPGALLAPRGVFRPLDLDLAHMAVAGGAFLEFGRRFGRSPADGPRHWLGRWVRVPVAVGVGVGCVSWVLEVWSDIEHLHLELLVFGWVLLAFVLGAGYLQRSYRSGDWVHRLRIKWVLLAGVCWMTACAVYVAVLAAYFLGVPVLRIGMVVVGVSAGLVTIGSVLLVYGMLTHGTIDPSFAIRKTTVFSALGFLFLFLVAGVENLLENSLEAGLGLPEGVSTVVVGGSIAVALLPIKRRMDRVMERLLPGERRESGADEPPDDR